MEIKKGTILIATDECIMNKTSFGNAGKPALIIGKEYKVKESTPNQIVIKSELEDIHYFDKKTITEFFKFK